MNMFGVPKYIVNTLPPTYAAADTGFSIVADAAAS
jgi:hypothetical protein